MNIYKIASQPSDVFFSPELSSKTLEEFIKNLPVITSFCNEQKISLERIEETNEKGYVEAMYFFNDDLGGYTLRALRESCNK